MGSPSAKEARIRVLHLDKTQTCLVTPAVCNRGLGVGLWVWLCLLSVTSCSNVRKAH